MGYGPLPHAPDSTTALIHGPWAHRVVRANGIALHVAELGSGPLIILLHGFPQFWWAWHEQLPPLAEAGYRVCAVDLRGYGSSDKPPRGYDVPTLAADVTALIAALGETEAVVVGSDVGGLLAATMAATTPDVVRALVLIGAAHPIAMRAAVVHDRDQRRASGYALRTMQLPRRPEHLLGQDGAWTTSLFDRWSGPGWKASPTYAADVACYAEAMQIHPVGYCAAEYFRWMGRSLLRPDGRAFAESLRGRLSAPTLVLQGSVDRCLLPATAQATGRHVTGEFRYRELDRVGHFPHNEAPQLVSRAIREWADDH